MTHFQKERQQFGKPISAFQAISFKLADMATELEAAELLNQNPFVNHNAAQLKAELKEKGIFRLFFSSYFVFFFHF